MPAELDAAKKVARSFAASAKSSVSGLCSSLHRSIVRSNTLNCSQAIAALSANLRITRSVHSTPDFTVANGTHGCLFIHSITSPFAERA